MGLNGEGRAVEITNGLYTLKVNADGSINAAAAGVAPNDTIIQGTLTLDGTTQQLAADVGAKTFTVQAAPGNSGQVYVGNATLNGTNGGWNYLRAAQKILL